MEKIFLLLFGIKKMGDLSKHFSRYEFRCKCGCGKDTIDAETLKLCELIREFVGKPISPSSGYRCETHNRHVHGSKNSQHLYGRAVDLPVRNPKSVFEMLCEIYPDKFGVGLYQSFVHVDTRKAARWKVI